MMLCSGFGTLLQINLRSLWLAAGGMAVLTVAVLLFILAYLYAKAKFSRRCQEMLHQFTQLIGEIIICESDEERQQLFAASAVEQWQKKYLNNSRSKQVLTHALVRLHKSVSGTAAANLQWLYLQLNLHSVAVQRLASAQWHHKAAAIQELAEMKQQQFITKIYRETNHRNYHIRTEAQLAVVKLTGFDGLRFLNVVSHPISEWQQLCLLQHLMQDGVVQENKICKWLQSSNHTVVVFALRLVGQYSVYALHQQVCVCLLHSSLAVRLQALAALQAIALDETGPLLQEHFSRATRAEQLIILNMLQQTGTTGQISFLQRLCLTEKGAVQHAAQKAVQALGITEEMIAGEKVVHQLLREDAA